MKKRPQGMWRMLHAAARHLGRRDKNGSTQSQYQGNPFTPAQPFPGVVPENKPSIPKIAMDAANAYKMALDQGPEFIGDQGWIGGFAANYFASAYAEGQEWLGYAVLAILSQRPEYRVQTDIYATEMTREWIEFKSKSEDKDKQPKIDELVERLEDLKLRSVTKASIENDGFQGRGQIYIDTGDNDNPEELKTPIGNGDKTSQAKFGKDGLAYDFSNGESRKTRIKRLAAVEPMWCYPSQYNADNPLNADWYHPEMWWIMGKEVHCSRLLTFISNPVPNMLMPAYSFGGISRTQLSKPYVDFYLRNRTSASDLLNNFSIPVLSTDLEVTTMDEGSELFNRVLTFNTIRDNQSTMVINKDSETFAVAQASLAGVKDLVGQSQEHMTTPSQIPIVKFFGNQPSGLNADSEGVIRLFYDRIRALQESLIREPIQTIVNLVQVELWGEVDDDIEFNFVELWQLDEAGKAAIQKTKADQRAIDIETGIISPEEGRQALARDPNSQYAGLDLDKPLPEPDPMMMDPEGGGEEGEEGEGVKPTHRDLGGLTNQAARFGGATSGGFSAHDSLAEDKVEWEEHLHPRDENGKFASSGSVATGWHKALQKAGFEQHPESPHAIYRHPSGHQVAFKSSGKGPAYKSAVYKNHEFSHELGHKMSEFEKAISQLELNPKPPEEKPIAEPETPKVNESFKSAVIGKGFQSIGTNPLTGNELFQHPETELSISLKPPEDSNKAVSTTPWSLFEKNGTLFAKGTGYENLKTEIKNAEYAAVEPESEPVKTTGPVSLPKGAEKLLPYKNEAGPGVVIYSDKPALESTEELVMSPDGEWTIWKKGGEGTVAKGDGQQSLNEAFEKLHPRDDSGKFVAKNDTAEEFTAGSILPDELNGVAFNKFTPPDDWNKVAGQKPDLVEPEMIVSPGKHVSAGLLMQEPDGRVWLVKPKNAYGGYNYTFPKGSKDYGENLQVAAIRESFEESGLHGEITGFAGDYEGQTSVTRYYLAKRIGGRPIDFEKESEAVTLVPPEKLHQYLNKERDQKIATNHFMGETPAKKGESAIKGSINFNELKKVGEKKGSNPGGTYESPDGKTYYVKYLKSIDHVKNEQLAAVLFRAAGGNTLDYHSVESTDLHPRIATSLEYLTADNVGQLTASERKKAQQDFALHAWLANWDAVGTGGDNIGVIAGQDLPTPLDFGGALLYRAQGAPKGDAFSEEATDWGTLRDPAKNPDASKFYGGMTDEELKTSAQRLTAISDNDIINLVDQFGPGSTFNKSDLADKLIKRRNSVLHQAGVSTQGGAATQPKPATPAAPPPPPEPPKNYYSEISDEQYAEYQKASPHPTAEERHGISTYTGGAYSEINNAMRKGLPVPSHYVDAVRGLNKWLNKCSWPEDGTVVTRWVQSEYAKTLREQLKTGMVFADHGFCSSDHWSGDLTMKIVLPKGAKAAAVRSWSQNKSESEITMKPGARFKVEEYKPGDNFIRLRYLLPDDPDYEAV